MRDMCSLLWCGLVGLFRSRASLEADILLLRHQLNILHQRLAMSSKAQFDLLDGAKLITGETFYIDGGYHVVD